MHFSVRVAGRVHVLDQEIALRGGHLQPQPVGPVVDDVGGLLRPVGKKRGDVQSEFLLLVGPVDDRVPGEDEEYDDEGYSAG